MTENVSNKSENEDPKEETIKSAVYAIGALQVETLKERLADLKDSDPNMKVRQAAIEALNMFEGNG